jgi:phosphohistidine phosphatase
MLVAARQLRLLVKDIDWIAASPLIRAQMTAALLARVYPHAERTSLELLAPGGDPVRLSKWLSKQKLPAVTALVGHEPGLSLWIGQMLVGQPKSIVRMKKGSVCCLEVEPEGRRLAGRLLWLMTLKQLIGF